MDGLAVDPQLIQDWPHYPLFLLEEGGKEVYGLYLLLALLLGQLVGLLEGLLGLDGEFI